MERQTTFLVKPTLTHLLMLAAKARPDEIEQYEALRGIEWDIDEITNDLYNRAGHIKFCLLDRHMMPIVAGGWENVMPGVWQSWMIGTHESWDRYWRSITRESRRVMDKLFESGARRLQTTALVSREAACAWYEKGLLMQREGILRGMGTNGEDVVIYSRLAPVRVEAVEYVTEGA